MLYLLLRNFRGSCYPTRTVRAHVIPTEVQLQDTCACSLQQSPVIGAGTHAGVALWDKPYMLLLLSTLEPARHTAKRDVIFVCCMCTDVIKEAEETC